MKNSFLVYKVPGIKILFPNFHKKLSSGFKKPSLHFTSPMKISKSKCSRKKNPFNFDSIKNFFRFKNFFRLHVLNEKLLPQFKKTVIE